MTWQSRDRRFGWADINVDLPGWLEPVRKGIDGVSVETLRRFSPPAEGGRHSSVLLLLGETNTRPDLLLIERAHTMRSHAGQPAFPGGAREPADADEWATAVREAQEETGVDPMGVRPFAVLPDLWVPVSGYVVTPVVAWWEQPSPVYVADPYEVASVHRVPIDELTEPANRMLVRHPSGYLCMGFSVRGLLVWGFTAGIISGLLDLAGWTREWDVTRIVELGGAA
jgi:8-oxo-dGTP pyrophosphatase MutT (NUDIX family)